MDSKQGKLEFDDKVEKSKFKRDFPTLLDATFGNKKALANAKKKKHFKNKKLR